MDSQTFSYTYSSDMRLDNFLELLSVLDENTRSNILQYIGNLFGNVDNKETIPSLMSTHKVVEAAYGVKLDPPRHYTSYLLPPKDRK
jgi:hypothetical protein